VRGGEAEGGGRLREVRRGNALERGEKEEDRAEVEEEEEDAVVDEVDEEGSNRAIADDDEHCSDPWPDMSLSV
jgi:hypothetical protein